MAWSPLSRKWGSQFRLTDENAAPTLIPRGSAQTTPTSAATTSTSGGRTVRVLPGRSQTSLLPPQPIDLSGLTPSQLARHRGMSQMKPEDLFGGTSPALSPEAQAAQTLGAAGLSLDQGKLLGDLATRWQQDRTALEEALLAQGYDTSLQGVHLDEALGLDTRTMNYLSALEPDLANEVYGMLLYQSSGGAVGSPVPDIFTGPSAEAMAAANKIIGQDIYQPADFYFGGVQDAAHTPGGRLQTVTNWYQNNLGMSQEDFVRDILYQGQGTAADIYGGVEGWIANQWAVAQAAGANPWEFVQVTTNELERAAQTWKEEQNLFDLSEGATTGETDDTASIVSAIISSLADAGLLGSSGLNEDAIRQALMSSGLKDYTAEPGAATAGM